MQPLNGEQEATMLRWAVTVGNRPGKRAKLFLQADRGLTEDQIDHWWDNAMASQEARKLHVRSIAPAPQMHSRALLECHGLPYEGSLTNPLNVPAPELMHVKHLTSSPQRPQTRSNGDDILFPIPTIPSQPVKQVDAYAHHRASLSTLSSTAPSFMTSTSSNSSKSTGSAKSNLSVPSQTWEIVDPPPSTSSVIPYGSSQPPLKDNASSMFSFVEVRPEDYMDVELTAQNEAFINPTKLSHPLNYPSFFENTQAGSLWGEHGPFAMSLPVGNGHGEPSHDHPKNYRPDAMSYPSFPVDPPEVEIVPKVEKALARFACTMCQRPFTNKGDWKRHEGSQCEPQKSWICMLGNSPAVLTDAGLACTFCDAIEPGHDSTEMFAHLEKEHKINQCIRKAPEDRSFRRKDKLKTHLQRLHNLCDNSNHWEKWQQSATQDKSAWGCGFCGVCLFTWEGRLEHIAEHFEKHLDISDWSQSLMIQGLLKQPSAEFNILEAWRTLVDADSDRQMEWTKDDAAELKLKLEFRKGTPTELAREAYRLAKSNTTSHAGDRMSIVKEIPWQQVGVVS